MNPPSNLSREKIRAILRAIEQRQHSTVKFEGDSHQRHTTILGADMNTGQLLLSEIYPNSPLPNQEKIPDMTFWLRIKEHEQYLAVNVCAEGVENGLLTVRICDTCWTTNKRWDSRIQFPDRQGPKVEIPIEFAPSAEGFVSDLSEHGAAIDIWGSKSKSMFSKGDVIVPRIEFNGSFVIRTESQVHSSTFLRQPCFHTQIRLKFSELTVVERSQLHNFIYSCHAVKNSA